MSRQSILHKPGTTHNEGATCLTQRNTNLLAATFFSGVRVPEIVASVLHSPGHPLDATLRRFMESRFGQDLGDIQLHTDTAAVQSAQMLSARAYTVGRHIVFGPEGYMINTPRSQRLLAHELTHAIQQRQPGGVNLDTAQREREARYAERSIASHAPMPSITAAKPALSRDPVPDTEVDAVLMASLAEISCDSDALFRVHLRWPHVVPYSRLMRAYTSCHQGENVPSQEPDLRPGPLANSERTPDTPAATGTTPDSTSGGGLSLPSTTIQFNLGQASVSINLPSSIAMRLPVPFRGAQRVVFELNASTSEFSFSATINAIPHVRIIARASVTTEGRGAAGLTIQTTRTTCHAVNSAAARSALQAAGIRLRDAIQAVQAPPEPDPEANKLERTFSPHARLAEVVGAVANLQSKIDRVGAPCREVPVASFNFGVQGQLTTSDEPTNPATPPASFIGGSLRFHF